MIREVPVEFHSEDSVLKLKKKNRRNEVTFGEKQVGSALGTQGNLLSLALAQLTLRCACGPISLPQDCPLDAEDFRAQQCSAYNDVQYQGCCYEWLPQYNDPAAPCALRCQARGQNLVVELAPKVLDGTRCTADSLDMCISGICQVSHTCFPDHWLEPVPRPLSVKITFLFCTSVHADEILSLRILM